MAGRKITKKAPKTRFSPELLSAYNEAIGKCLSSPRYPMVRNLHLDELLGAGTHAGILFKGKLIFDLADAGIQGLLKIEDLQADDIRALIDILERFSVPFECACEEHAGSTPAQSPQPETAKKAALEDGLLAIERSSIEMELAEKKHGLKRISSDLLSSKLLGDYWQEGWPRAPFEEALSFKQLSDLDFETLVRKRTFDIHKMNSLIKAIDAFVSEHDVRKRGGTSQSNLTERPFIPSALPGIAFENDGFPLPLITQNLVRYFEYQCSLYLNAIGPLKILFAHLPLTLKAHEAALLALSVNDAPSLSRRLLRLSKEDFDNMLSGAQSKLRQLFERACPKVAGAWTAALSSPGIAEEHLFAPYFDEAFDEEFQRIVFRTLVRTLGAEHPVIAGESFPDLWTMNSEAASVLAKSLVNESKDEKDLWAKITKLLPAFPPEQVISVLDRTSDNL